MSEEMTAEARRCTYCQCTDDAACSTPAGPCHWVSLDPPVCSNPACVALQQAAAAVPVYRESLSGALIDSARISVMAAIALLPPADAPRIILPGDSHDPTDPTATSQGCLDEAMAWLDAARVHTLNAGAIATSLHVVGARR